MRVWYEPQRHQRPKRINLPPHAGARVPITLEIFHRTHLEGVRFSFTGGPNAPEIVDLFDWNTGEGLDEKPLHQNVHILSDDRVAWYWEYETSLLRTKGNTVAIGLFVKTKDTFAGYLEVQPTFEERTKIPKPYTLRVCVR